ncbi:MAG: protein of unknown function transrane [Deltaproteobacteria bacterium]|nr:protein of unknown function transrane [Deltaproteobacteria bacterium]
MPGTIHAEKHVTSRPFAFGVVKGRLTGIDPLLGGLQTVCIGGIAATEAFGIARWIS